MRASRRVGGLRCRATGHQDNARKLEDRKASRVRSASAAHEAPCHKPAGSLPKGAEVDAYLVEAMRRFPAGRPPLEGRIAREEVYLRWLKERLQDAARVDAARIVSFERRKALRGATQREGPEVVWHGELSVLDSSAFSARLASGVGRHAAYGFGMLLLRPSGGEDAHAGGTARP